MKRSLGKMSKRSRLLRKRVGQKKLGLTKLLKHFKKGDQVTLDYKSGYFNHPHPRYRGRHGVVLEKRGDAYVVSIRDIDATKKLVVPSVHLEKVV